MECVVRQVHECLIKNKKTIAVAESCTGGLTSSLLTRLPGSSSYFLLGTVVYSNQAKEKILKIPKRIIATKGAVSKEVARLMAHSVKKLAKSDFGVGITGIAGPTGGRSDKPAGTVFIALEGNHRKICKRIRFKGSRDLVRKKTALQALKMLKGMAV